jgi:hypothetical protein
MGPFALDGITSILVHLAIGFGFGFVLERAGFGDSRRLAAQFYLRDMTVLKVMFTAIVTAMVLVHFAWAVGWVDLSRVFVNPTYLASGVLGGLVMGVGFIVGGYCPGTSLVAAATLKLDGVFFVLGVTLGVFVFGEVVPSFWDFFQNAGAMGRFTLADWLGIPTVLVTFLVACMAVFMFWGAERLEAVFGDAPREEPTEAPEATTEVVR